jgi:hypothetical protein
MGAEKSCRVVVRARSGGPSRVYDERELCRDGSEPLTMEQEYEMQQSWRLDEDSKSAFAPKQPVCVGALATHAVACCISSLAIHSWYRGTCQRRYGRRTIRSPRRSEPLTMEQEYEMQQSWRLDEDSKSAFAPKQPAWSKNRHGR